MTIDYFQKYTSAIMLAGYDEARMTASSIACFRRNILPHLPPSKTAAILDVGCGYGRYLKAMTEDGYRNVYGVDASEEQIRYAQDRLGMKNCQVADGLSFLADRQEAYEAILLLDVLEHLSLDDSIRMVRYAHGALREGGRLLVQVPNAVSPLSILRYSDVTHQRAYTTRSLEQTCLLAGGGWAVRHFGLLLTAPNGLVGFMRRLLWHGVLWPMTHALVLVTYGRHNQGIYTANLLTVAQKTAGS